MGNPELLEIELPSHVGEDNRSIVEPLVVEQIGPNRYRLVLSPGMVEGLAAGDEFELSNTDNSGFKVLRRGGNICVWFFFADIGQNCGPEAERLRAAVEAIGGKLDGGGTYLLVFTIPLTAKFSTIERIFDGIASHNAGSTWLYGNVYNPKDGSLLNWWE